MPSICPSASPGAGTGALDPVLDYPPEIRKVIYTTNAIESVNMSLRKLTKNRGSFQRRGALMKLFYLALRNISQKWTMPIRDWKAALTRFTIQFGDRISVTEVRPVLHKIPDTPATSRRCGGSINAVARPAVLHCWPPPSAAAPPHSPTLTASSIAAATGAYRIRVVVAEGFCTSYSDRPALTRNSPSS